MQCGNCDGAGDSSRSCDSHAHEALVALLSSITEVESLVFMDARIDSGDRAPAAKRVRFACYDLSASTTIGDCGNGVAPREADGARARAQRADALLLKLEDAVDAGQQLRTLLVNISDSRECSESGACATPSAPGAPLSP